MKRRLLIITAASLLLLAAALAGLLMTTPGLTLALRLALPLASGAVSIDRAEGRLAGPLVVEGLRWHAAGYQGTVERLQLDWEPLALLRRELAVERLSASGVYIEPNPDAQRDTASGPPAWPESITVPLALTVTQVAISDVRFRASEDAVPLTADTLGFAVTTTEGSLHVDRIAVAGDQVGIAGSLTLVTGRDYQASTKLDWWLAYGNFARTGGRLEAQLVKRAIEVRQAFSEPAAAELVGSVEFRQAVPAWEVTARLPDTALDAVNTGWPRLRVGGDLTLAGNGGDAGLNGTVSLPDYLPAAMGVVGSLALAEGRLAIEPLDVALVSRSEAVKVVGSIDVINVLSGNSTLRATWQDLQWPLAPAPVVISDSGSVSIEGNPSAFSFRLEAGADGDTVPATQFTAAGTGSTRVIDIDTLQADLLNGRVQGGARVNLADTPTATVQLRAIGLDPSSEFPDWRGNLNFDLESSVASNRFEARVSDLRGTLRGFSWSGSGGVSFDGAQWTAEDIALASKGAQLALSGHVGQSIDLRWELVADDLSVIHPRGSGELRTSGSVSGTTARPVIVASLSGQRLQWDSFAAGGVTLEATVDVSDSSNSTMVAQATALAVAGRELDTLTVNASGLASDHVVDVQAASNASQLTARLAGGWQAPRWQGAITALELAPERQVLWSLASPAPLVLARDGVLLDPLCLAAGRERACLQGQYGATDGIDAGATLTDLELSRLAPLIPGVPALSGLVSARASLRGTELATASGSLNAELSEGLLEESLGDSDEPLIEDATGRLDITLESQRLNAVGTLGLGDNGTVDITINLPVDLQSAPEDLPVSGTLNAATRSLALLPLFSGDLDRVVGELQADLTLSGTVSAPVFTGDFVLSDAKADLPNFGLSFTGINVTMTAREQGLAVTGQLRSGTGSASFEGDLTFAGGMPTGNLALNGSALTIVDLPQIRIDATPDVTVAIDGRDVTFRGTVGVPFARVTPLDVSDAVRVSPDQIIVTTDLTPQQTDNRIRTTTDVELLIGKDVEIDAYGLTGNIDGRLAIFDSPDSLTTATGELAVIDGMYEAWGQELEVTRGRLIFSGGEITKPAIDVSAQRTIDAQTVGVNLRGNLANPELSVFSDPLLPSTDAFSYLLTGRNLNSASDADRQYVDTASNALALRGGALLASQIGRQLGLDDVALEGADNREETRFVIGTYLSPDLYVSFGLGLFEAVNALRVRYRLNNNWSIAVESGEESSTDVEYTLER